MRECIIRVDFFNGCEDLTRVCIKRVCCGKVSFTIYDVNCEHEQTFIYAGYDREKATRIMNSTGNMTIEDENLMRGEE